MAVDRARLEARRGHSVDLIGEDGAALVVILGPIDDGANEPQLHIQVLAVERRGTSWRLDPGDCGTVRLSQVRDVRPVVFLSGSGM
jgi:hypothetical protein